MGAGASIKDHKHHSKRIPSPPPPGESLSPLKDTVQPKIPVQDQHISHEAQNKDIKEQVNVAPTSQTSTDKKASPNDTLERYKAKYPDQAEDLETMLERLQALKDFVDKNLNDSVAMPRWVRRPRVYFIKASSQSSPLGLERKNSSPHLSNSPLMSVALNN